MKRTLIIRCPRCEPGVVAVFSVLCVRCRPTPRAMRALVVLLALWPATVQAHAHFSPSEQAGLSHAFAAAIAGTEATTFTNPECLTALFRAQRDTGKVPLAIAGGYPDRATRNTQLLQFQFHLNRAITDSVPGALACVVRRRMERAGDADALRVAEEALRAALFHLRAIDATLPYADPSPQALLPGQTVPAVVGPHGIYAEAIGEAFWMGHYTRDMMQHGVLPLWQRKRMNAGQLRTILQRYRSVSLWQWDSAMKISGEPTSQFQDRFCTALYVGDTLTAGHNAKPSLPEQYFSLMLLIQEIVTPDGDARRLLQSHADMFWRTSGFSWAILMENEPIRKRCGLPPL